MSFAGGDPGVALAGTLALPAGAGPHPAVLLLSGSGAQDRDETIAGHKPFKVLSNYLVARGIAVLRVDDRGTGASTGDFWEAGLPELVRDALAGVALLRSRPEVRGDAIGLVGHSQGGVVAPLAAVQSRHVAFLVLLASPGIPFTDLLAVQSRDLLASERADTAVVAATAALHRARRGIMETAQDSATMRADLQRIAAAYFDAPAFAAFTSEQKAAFVRVVVGTWMSPAYLSMSQYDPAATLGRVTVPVLALNGDRDVQVAARPNLAAIAAALRAGGNSRVTTRELPGLNHMFQHAGTGAISEYGSIGEAFAPEALQAIGDWILLTVRPR